MFVCCTTYYYVRGKVVAAMQIWLPQTGHRE